MQGNPRAVPQILILPPLTLKERCQTFLLMSILRSLRSRNAKTNTKGLLCEGTASVPAINLSSFPPS